MDCLKISFDVVKEESSKVFNENVMELTEYIFTESLSEYRNQNLDDYFRMVETMLKNFGPCLAEKVPPQKICAFMQALFEKIEETTASCDSNPSLMIESSVLRLNLDIFEALCRSKNLYEVHNQDLDRMLRMIWDTVLPLSLKDKTIKEMLIDVLAGHYNATKSKLLNATS